MRKKILYHPLYCLYFSALDIKKLLAKNKLEIYFIDFIHNYYYIAVWIAKHWRTSLTDTQRQTETASTTNKKLTSRRTSKTMKKQKKCMFISMFEKSHKCSSPLSSHPALSPIMFDDLWIRFLFSFFFLQPFKIKFMFRFWGGGKCVMLDEILSQYKGYCMIFW